tara:strand:- start:9863 stop:10363 length:501 start_codon:yes stop_codon:yes gene_type:complete
MKIFLNSRDLFLFGILFAFLDQLSKVIVLSNLSLGSRVNVFPGFFDFIHVRNPGGAFSFLAGLPPSISKWLFISVTFFALFFVVYLYLHEFSDSSLARFALIFIFGGGIGNLVDRFLYGEVVDFILLYSGSFYWPAFNIADSGISIGVVILLFIILRTSFSKKTIS